jgi:hypothetical protein
MAQATLSKFEMSESATYAPKVLVEIELFNLKVLFPYLSIGLRIGQIKKSISLNDRLQVIPNRVEQAGLGC